MLPSTHERQRDPTCADTSVSPRATSRILACSPGAGLQRKRGNPDGATGARPHPFPLRTPQPRTPPGSFQAHNGPRNSLAPWQQLGFPGALRSGLPRRSPSRPSWRWLAPRGVPSRERPAACKGVIGASHSSIRPERSSVPGGASHMNSYDAVPRHVRASEAGEPGGLGVCAVFSWAGWWEVFLLCWPLHRWRLAVARRAATCNTVLPGRCTGSGGV